ncbi:MAG: hypothetical protein SVU88_00670 [Candidatus Nanohaloarchaea archaeon]|nr:hypothetical protein [Candidatus Nanohaloarchaea archaeon]
MDIESRTPVSGTEVRAQLEEVEDRNEVQRTTFEHLTKHLAVHDTETLAELKEEISGLNSFREEHVLKIIETLPRSEQEVAALFSKERIKLDDDEVQQVVDFAESIGSR